MPTTPTAQPPADLAEQRSVGSTQTREDPPLEWGRVLPRSPGMRIEIWSDVVCPWCYIGKRRLESALAGFPHRDEVEIVWRSYQLDPGAPTEPTETAQQMLGRKYGMTPAQAAQAQQRVIFQAAEEGMHWKHEHSMHNNTRAAHRLLHLAAELGGAAKQGELKEALLHAYFGEAAVVSDHEVLRRIAADVGLDAERVEQVLASREYDDAVQADIDQAAAYGATGVPFFVVEQKYGVSGAQPTELFTQVLERAWSDAHPALETVGGADVCGPDGCAI
jgi:predicted DsbA family dithiol-disulfide isomerase